jgi:hypothetical protein
MEVGRSVRSRRATLLWKRWVLKSNDSRTISQIDAVFVAVEPEGGSAKPSGKSLLFTNLPFDPDRP